MAQVADPPAAVLRRRLPRVLLGLPSDVAALLALPFVLILINASWTYVVPNGWIDNYLYTGYMLNLRHYLHDFSGTYYGSRLPWLALGSLVHSLLPFDAANLTLRLLLFYGSAFSMYLLVRSIWHSRLAAIVAAMFFCLHASFLSAVSWDYIDGPGIVCLIMLLALMTAAIEARSWQPLLFIAGFVGASAVGTQLFLLVFMPLPLIWFVLLNWRRGSPRPLLTSALLIAVGAAVGFLFYCVLNQYLGAPFDFLQPQVHAAKAQEPAYRAHGTAWLKGAGWLAFTALACVLALFAIARAGWWLALHRKPRELPDNHFVAAGAGALLLAACFYPAYAQLSGRAAILQLPFYTDYLLPFVFLVFAAVMAPALASVPRRRQLAAGLIAALVLLAPFAIHALQTSNRMPLPSILDERLVVLAVGGVLMLATLLRRDARLVLLGLTALSLANLLLSDRRFIFLDHRTAQRQQFDLIWDADQQLQAFDQDGAMRYWYNNTEPLAGVYVAVASVHLFEYRLVGQDFPKRTNLNDGSQIPLAPGERLAILSAKADPMAGLDVAPELQVVHRGTIKEGAQSFNLVVADVVPTGFVPAQQLNLSDLTGTTCSKVSRPGDGDVSITLQPIAWCYAGVLRFAALTDQLQPGPAYVRARVKAEGTVGLGILQKDEQGFLDRVPVTARGTTDVYLRITDLHNVSSFVVQNWDTAKAAHIQILQVTLYLPAASP